MTPRDKTLFTDTITGVQIFEDNLDQIFSILRKHSLDSLEIYDQNNIYENILELKTHNGIHPKTLRIKAKESGKHYFPVDLNFKKKSVLIYCTGSELYSLGFELRDYLKGTRRWYIRLFNWGWFYAFLGVSFTIGATFYNKNSVIQPVVLWFWCSFLLMLLITALIQSITYGLNLCRRHEYGFWVRNRDKIILAIFAAILGIIGTLIIQWVTKK